MPVFGPAPRPGEAIGARSLWLLLAFLIITTYSVVFEYALSLVAIGVSHELGLVK